MIRVKKLYLGTSVVVQWLTLWGRGFERWSPLGTRSHIPQFKIPQAAPKTCYSQINKNEQQQKLCLLANSIPHPSFDFYFLHTPSPTTFSLLFPLSSLPPSPALHAQSELALNSDKLACASFMTKLLGLSPTPHRWSQTSDTPLGEPHVCKPAGNGQAEKRDGEWQCLSPGGRRSRFQEETGVSFPRARRALGPGPGPPPSPARSSGKSQSPHTGTRRPRGRAQRRAAPTANCYGNPGVRSIPHPAGPPASCLSGSQPACARPGSAL